MACGTSMRTLERAFQRVHGHTIVAQIRRIRLDRARHELIAARGTGRSVTDIAVSVGMLHAGRFSVAYRTRFGESPSHTLRGSCRVPPQLKH